MNYDKSKSISGDIRRTCGSGNKRIAVILVNYNGYEDTRECINSIACSTYSNVVVYVVDNNAKQKVDSYNTIIDEKVRLINLDTNVGFGAANNIAAKAAVRDGADVLLILNNDTIVENHMIDRLIQYVDCKTIVCPIMYFYDTESAWYGGGELSPWSGRASHRHYNKCRKISFITGCCFMLLAETYEAIGLFPEEYFMYYEDVDFSLKAQQCNLNLLYVPSAKLWHKVGHSINKTYGLKSYYLNRNRLYIYKKYKNYFHNTVYIIFLLTRIKDIVFGLCRVKKYQPIIDAIVDYKRGIQGKTDRMYPDLQGDTLAD